VRQPAPLPIDGVLVDVQAALADHSAVLLSAPPGSGKTTRVPGAVLEVVEGRVLLLQPRRVAARSVAARIASEMGTRLGDRVGYWVRFDRTASDATEILVLTEGLLTRLLQSDPFLEGVGAVILDEFHERSLHSDMGLALLAEVIRDARPDMKLIVMSATLDAGPIQQFLGGPSQCPIISASGRTFPVEIEYRPTDPDGRLESQVAAAIHDAVAADANGHVLVFLPGVGEIERVSERLTSLPKTTLVLPLHGRLPPSEQDKALHKCSGQKVVLATNIAETSLTIDGVTTVVDSGLARRPRFDPRLGVERLETVPISAASAEQRAGRAGRTRPGRCVRLWSTQNHALRPAQEAPSIQLADLASTVLDLYAWGTDPKAFAWFEPPPDASVAHAVGLLGSLGALDGPRLSAVGTALARLPVHPRLGRVVVRGVELGVLHEAASAAALASERDPWAHEEGVDLLTRLDWLDSRHRTGANPRAIAAVRRVRDDLVRIGNRTKVRGVASQSPADTRVIEALIAGFPDRVGRRRSGDRRSVLLASGNGVELGRGVDPGEWMVVVTLTAGARGRPPLVRVASALDPSLLECPWVDEAFFEREREAVVQRRVRRWGAIVLAEKPSQTPAAPEVVSACLAEAVHPRSERLFPFSGEDGRMLARLRFAERVRPKEEWPSWIANPRSLVDEWCMGRRSFADLRKLDVAADLLARLPWALRTVFEHVAPERMTVPSGAKIRLEYPIDQAPVLAARIQQMFGLMSTPKLGGVPVTVHLLAPNGRPAQQTQDLASFWANTYADVRKDLRGRYPRHAWPEDPSEAIAENRPKRKR
jgi:ATP-dependent helicase HrpB